MNEMDRDLSQVHLAYLADHPTHATEIGDLKYAQWRHTSPDRRYEVWIEEIRDSARSDSFPMTLIALAASELVGFVTLIELDNRAGILNGLWLITLYVKASHRRQGIGTRLLDRCTAEASRAGYPALYLWTESPELTSYYARQGWRCLGQDDDGDDVMMWATDQL